MPRFSYIAIDTGGKTVKGSINAENAFAARKHLRLRHLHPTSLDEATVADSGRMFLVSLLPGRGKNQVTDFTRQMATLLGAGIKLTEGLNVLMHQCTGKFAHVLMDIRDRLVSGESFADALDDYPEFFDVVYVSMVRVGEATGGLERSLETVATFLEKKQRVSSKVVTVMIYPALLLSMLLVAIVILTNMVITPIGRQLERLGQQLPGPTRVLMAMGVGMRDWWPAILIGVVALIWLLRKAMKTRRGSYLRDKALISLPIFGPLVKQRIVARFAATLSALIASGLSMAESLKVVAQVTGNTIMSDAVRQARERILSGADISTPLRDSGVVDPATAHMISVGEASGELDLMLARISENLESRTDTVIERLSAALEPVLMLGVAIMIGMLAYAALLPILRLSTSLTN